jgi:hypothetical protein
LGSKKISFLFLVDGLSLKKTGLQVIYPINVGINSIKNAQFSIGDFFTVEN